MDSPIFGTSCDPLKLSTAVVEIKIITTICPAALIWDRLRKPTWWLTCLSLFPSKLCPWPVAALYDLFPPATPSSWLREDSDIGTASAMVIFHSRNCTTPVGRPVLPAERLQATSVLACSHTTCKPFSGWVAHRNTCMQYISKYMCFLPQMLLTT